jgi:hypothetical protein
MLPVVVGSLVTCLWWDMLPVVVGSLVTCLWWDMLPVVVGSLVTCLWWDHVTCLWWDNLLPVSDGIMLPVYGEIISYLSLMGSLVPGQMQETVTVSTQIATLTTQNDGLGLPIIVVITGRL